MPEELSFRTVEEQEGLSVEARRVFAAAKTTFGDGDKAERWLKRPTAALDGVSPLEMIESVGGIRKVEDLLARIDHGLAM